MAKFKKAILEADREYQSPDGPVFVTADRLKHWADSFHDMRSRGLVVPISWGHDDDPEKGVPESADAVLANDRRRRPPEGTVGYLHEVRLTADGKRAEIELDVRRKADIEAVDANLAYVSPVIRTEWQDGDGTKWDDIWGHMDLVQHPVDHRQTPFERVPDTETEETPGVLACALRMGLDAGTPTTYRLSGCTDCEKDQKPMDEEKKEAPAADDSESTESKEEKVEEQVVSDDTGRMKKVLDALSSMDIVLSDDTTEENFLAHLEQALLTSAAINGQGDSIDDGAGDLEVTAPQFAAMSLERKKEKLYIDNQHRTQVAQRLSTLCSQGRCTPAEQKQIAKGLPRVRLSLDDSGKPVPSSVEQWIASREAVPQGTFWSKEQRARMSTTEEVAQPDIVNEGDTVETHEQADKIADEVLGRAS